MKESLTHRGLYREIAVAGNLVGLALVLAACKAPEAPAKAPVVAQLRTTSLPLGDRRARVELEVDPQSETVRALAPGRHRPAQRSRPAQPRHSLWDRPSLASTLTRPVEGGMLAAVGGEALTAALAALPEARRALGLAGLTTAQLFGAAGGGDGLCESPRVDFSPVLDGVTFQARYTPDPALITSKPLPALYALSSTCTAALAASGGTLASAVGNGCTREDEAAHFAAGSACRTCLTADGDHARCLAAQSCPAQTARTIMVREAGRNEYMDVFEATMLSCAPNYLSTLLVLTHDRGPGDPDIVPFDHTQVTRTCAYYWSTQAGEPRLNCSFEQGSVRLAMSDVLIMRADYIRRPGDTRTPLHRRTVLASRMELDGVLYESMALYPGALAEISEPDVRTGGYGMAPNALRADGTDLANIDHTHARDWLGTIAMKTTTTLDGVPFALYNNNLCPDADWRGPDALGRFHCRPPFFDDEANPAPELYDWQYDYGGFYVGLNPVRIEMIPTVTLGATGLMDPTIPGGHVPHILGTPVLADPDWESCAWPDQFQPDEQTAYDIRQAGTPTFTMQTYRFGKDPRQDIRVVLATNWRRGFCFEDL